MISLSDSHYRNHARLSLLGILNRGAEFYNRNKVLPILLPLMREELKGPEPQTTERIVQLLAKALRKERLYGRAGSRFYDLNRHIALAQAYKAEQAGLEIGFDRKART